MISPESVVILRWPRGYVAYLRFLDSKFDINISHYNKDYLYQLIEKNIEAINGTHIRDPRKTL